MSLFSSTTGWPTACTGPNQSPINLSQSFAKECELLCDLSIDEVSVSSAEMMGDTERGLILTYASTKPSCTFKGDGYTATYSLLTHPSQHTVEGVQAQAEFTTYFTSPKGTVLAVSILLRSSPGPSTFFGRFVPYLTTTGEAISVVLGDDWSLTQIVPSTPSFYTYDGSDVLPNCGPITWVVFSETMTIDPSDLALLGQRVPAGSRALQQLGDRDVFYNDSQNPAGGSHLKQDGKVYMKCRRLGTGGGGDAQPVGQSGLQAAKAEQDQSKLYDTVDATVVKPFNDYIAANGFMGIGAVILFLLFAYLFFGTLSGGQFVTGFLGVLMKAVYYIFRWPVEKVYGFLMRKPADVAFTTSAGTV